MAGEQHGAPLGGEAAQEVAQPADALGVEPVGGLVEHEDARVAEQRGREAEPLGHAEREAAERRRAAPPRSTSSSSSSARESGIPPSAASTRRWLRARARGMRGRLEHDPDLRERVGELGVREAVDGGAPGGGGDQADERAQGGRLAGSVGTEEADDLALVDVEAQVVDGPHGAEVLGEVLNRDDGHVQVIIRSRAPPPRACCLGGRGERRGTLTRTDGMRITVTGGQRPDRRKLVERLRARGDDVTMLSRNPTAPGAVGVAARAGAGARRRRSRGRDAVVHLAGEDVAQRWSDDAKRAHPRARASSGTRNLVAGIDAADPRPRVLVSPPPSATTARTATSGSTRTRRPGDDFLAEVCVSWEREARRGRRSACASCTCAPASCSTQGGGALAKMLPPFKARRRRPGRRRRAVHAVDPPRRRRRASTSPRSTATPGQGPVNATAPEPVTNKAFSKALGRALHRPAVAPGPGLRDPGALRRDGARSSPRASAWSRARAPSSATRSGTPTSTRPCASALAFVIAVWPESAARRTSRPRAACGDAATSCARATRRSRPRRDRPAR